MRRAGECDDARCDGRGDRRAAAHRGASARILATETVVLRERAQLGVTSRLPNKPLAKVFYSPSPAVILHQLARLPTTPPKDALEAPRTPSCASSNPRTERNPSREPPRPSALRSAAAAPVLRTRRLDQSGEAHHPDRPSRELLREPCAPNPTPNIPPCGPPRAGSSRGAPRLSRRGARVRAACGQYMRSTPSGRPRRRRAPRAPPSAPPSATPRRTSQARKRREYDARKPTAAAGLPRPEHRAPTRQRQRPTRTQPRRRRYSAAPVTLTAMTQRLGSLSIETHVGAQQFRRRRAAGRGERAGNTAPYSRIVRDVPPRRPRRPHLHAIAAVFLREERRRPRRGAPPPPSRASFRRAAQNTLNPSRTTQ